MSAWPLLEADPPAELSTAALRLLAALCDLEAPGDPDGDRDGEGEAGPPFAGYLAAADAHVAVVRHLQGPPAVAAQRPALRRFSGGGDWGWACFDSGPHRFSLKLLVAFLNSPCAQSPESILQF